MLVDDARGPRKMGAGNPFPLFSEELK